jgi:hypothetical protein
VITGRLDYKHVTWYDDADNVITVPLPSFWKSEDNL